jgi:two-component system response regulator AtoC
VTCGGIPEELLESELFGYAQGAYQRAMLPRAGKAELASRGTLYLSDIEKAGPRIQEKILRLLTTKTVSQVGSDRDIEVDVRLVASSASPIDALAERGKFLRALHDALQPGLIRFPPLRERAEDIPLLLHHYLFESNRKRKKPLRGVSEAALSALTAYPWPGNVRELAELVSSIASRKKQGSVVDAADLPTEILYGRKRKAGMDESPAAKPPPDIRDAIKDLDNQMVKQALALSEGDREKAAALLNIEVAVLEKRMREGGVEEEPPGEGR